MSPTGGVTGIGRQVTPRIHVFYSVHPIGTRASVGGGIRLDTAFTPGI